MRIALLGPGKGALYRQVVFTCKWSLGQVRLYMYKELSFSVCFGHDLKTSRKLLRLLQGSG